MIFDVPIPPYGLALIAGFLFALGGQIQHMGLQTLDARTGTMLSICSSAGMYWLAAQMMDCRVQMPMLQCLRARRVLTSLA